MRLMLSCMTVLCNLLLESAVDGRSCSLGAEFSFPRYLG
jgi:hypothetical protein